MLKKRLIGVVTVKDGWAVQSFGYRRYLPLGKPACVVENLCRWGADEILVHVIDRSAGNSGPDFSLISSLAELGLETPLIYGGGIRTVNDGIRVIQTGADRLSLDILLHDNLTIVRELAKQLGSQALIAAMPVSRDDHNILWLDYRNMQSDLLAADFLEALKEHLVSEVLLVDWKNEGGANSFDEELVVKFPDIDVPLIAFGGISEHKQMVDLLQRSNISAIAVGNCLNYKEHGIQRLKESLAFMSLRPPTYSRDEYIE